MPQFRDQESPVYASPVYLAGDASGEPALRPLRDAGFHQTIDVKGNARLTSPDGGLQVDYFPNGLTHGLWTIFEAPDRYTPATWKVSFTHGTPPEVVAAVTTALTQDAQPWTRGQQPGVEDILRPLANTGWRRREDDWEIDFTSPDERATVSYDTTPGHPLDPDYEPWLITGARDLGHDYEWLGAFTTETPAHLVATTTVRLADPAPVPRPAAAVLHAESTLTEAAAHSPTPANAPRASAALSRSSAATPPREGPPQTSSTPAQATSQCSTTRSHPRR